MSTLDEILNQWKSTLVSHEDVETRLRARILELESRLARWERAYGATLEDLEEMVATDMEDEYKVNPKMSH